MTEGQEQTGEWRKHPGPPGHDWGNSADAAERRGSDRSPDLLQMLRAAENRRGPPLSQDQDRAEAGGPVPEAQRTDMVSWDVNVVHSCVGQCECDIGGMTVHKLEVLMISEGTLRSLNISPAHSALILGH